LVRESAVEPAPEEPIPVFQGRPVLVKTSRVRRPVATAELRVRQSHYLIELGLRCAALGRSEGTLAVGYDYVPAGDDPVRCYQVRFDPLQPWSDRLAEREGLLLESLRRDDPSGLPPCPDWMFESCPHAPGCGDPSSSPV
jgi:hypothetical protein